MPLIRRFAGKIPILGVCLGHQAIGQAFGGTHRARAARDARQAVADRRTTSAACSPGVPSPFNGDALPFARDRARERCRACLEVTATADDGEIMGVRHRELPVEGVQFHPEAILTEHGQTLLANFLAATV